MQTQTIAQALTNLNLILIELKIEPICMYPKKNTNSSSSPINIPDHGKYTATNEI